MLNAFLGYGGVPSPQVLTSRAACGNSVLMQAIPPPVAPPNLHRKKLREEEEEGRKEGDGRSLARLFYTLLCLSTKWTWSFSHCDDKPPKQKQPKREKMYFGLQCEVIVHHSQGSQQEHDQEAVRGECWDSIMLSDPSPWDGIVHI